MKSIKHVTALLIFLTMASCVETFYKGEKAYSGKYATTIAVYKIATPIDSTALAGMKLDIVEKKKIRNELPNLFPVLVQVMEINEDQFYKNKNGNLLGTIVEVTEVSYDRIRKRLTPAYQIDFDSDVKLLKYDGGFETEEILKDKRYVLSKALYVRNTDIAKEANPKYN